MSKNYMIKIVSISIVIISLIIAIVLFYQYYTCKENVNYAVESAANYYNIYSFGNGGLNYYNSYSNSMEKSGGYLIGSIISVFISAVSGVYIIKLKKKEKTK